LVRQLIQRSPWSLTFAGSPALTLVATLGGQASIRLDDARAAPVRLTPGGLVIISRTGGHTIADDPVTPPQVVIRGGGKYAIAGGELVADGRWNMAPAPMATASRNPRPWSSSPTRNRSRP
jgi:hypothetical protein